MQDYKMQYIDSYAQETLSDIVSNEQLTQYALNNLFISLKKLEIETRKIKDNIVAHAGTLGISKLVAVGASIDELAIELEHIKRKYHL